MNSHAAKPIPSAIGSDVPVLNSSIIMPVAAARPRRAAYRFGCSVLHLPTGPTVPSLLRLSAAKRGPAIMKMRTQLNSPPRMAMSRPTSSEISNVINPAGMRLAQAAVSHGCS